MSAFQQQLRSIRDAKDKFVDKLSHDFAEASARISTTLSRSSFRDVEIPPPPPPMASPNLASPNLASVNPLNTNGPDARPLELYQIPPHQLSHGAHSSGHRSIYSLRSLLAGSTHSTAPVQTLSRPRNSFMSSGNPVFDLEAFETGGVPGAHQMGEPLNTVYESNMEETAEEEYNRLSRISKSLRDLPQVIPNKALAQLGLLEDPMHPTIVKATKVKHGRYMENHCTKRSLLIILAFLFVVIVGGAGAGMSLSQTANGEQLEQGVSNGTTASPTTAAPVPPPTNTPTTKSPTLPTSSPTPPTSSPTPPTKSPTPPTRSPTPPTSSPTPPTKSPTPPTSSPTPPTKSPTPPTSSPTPPTKSPTPPTSSPTPPTKSPTPPTSSPTPPTESPTPPTASPTLATKAPTVVTLSPTVPTSEPTDATLEPTQSDPYEEPTLAPTKKGKPNDDY